jgi:hypothetical protein
MKKLPLLDLLSLVVILALGYQLYQVQQRVTRLETVTRGAGDALDAAKLLPMPATTGAGQHVTVARGEPRLIFYMSPHCGYCGKNMPVWSDIAHRVGLNHALFLVGDEREMPQMPAYLAKYAVAAVPAVAADPEVLGRYYMMQVPKTVLVSGDGKVEKVWRGAVTTEAVLQAWTSAVKR